LETLIDQSKYTITGADTDIDNNPIFEIPANTEYVDISIEPLANNTQTQDETIEIRLLDDDEIEAEDYDIDTDNRSVTVIVKDSTPVLLPTIQFENGGSALTSTVNSTGVSLRISITPSIDTTQFVLVWFTYTITYRRIATNQIESFSYDSNPLNFLLNPGATLGFHSNLFLGVLPISLTATLTGRVSYFPSGVNLVPNVNYVFGANATISLLPS
jgi:hypothetical protein